MAFLLQIRSLMHDYLATDGESSLRPGEDADNKRMLYAGLRDKNKVSFKNNTGQSTSY